MTDPSGLAIDCARQNAKTASESLCEMVVVVLGEMYGKKRWTLFEASQYKDRIDVGDVVPIWSTRVPPSPFDDVRSRGGLDFDPNGDLLQQARVHAGILSRMIAERSDDT